MEQYTGYADVGVDTESRLRLFRTLDESSQLEAVRKPKMSRLANMGNTCAIDSVLSALFAHFTEMKTEHKHPAKIKIAEWVKDIEARESIADLVPSFKSFPSEDNFHSVGAPRDAIEFLMYFLKIFSEDIVSTKVFKTVNRGVVTSASIDRKSSPVQYVPANVLVERERVAVQDFIVNTNVVGDGDRVTTEEIVQSDLVVFAFGRNMSDGVFVSTPVVPSPSLTTPNGDRFFLGSVVVVDNNHYSAYVRDVATWYAYDDFSPAWRPVGPFSAMGEWSPSPMTNGVLYFYFPDYSSVEEHVVSLWTDPNRLDVGVFEDVVTDKLLNLHSMFGSVSVSPSLPVLSRLEKSGGDPRMHVCDAKSFLQLFRDH